MANALVDAGAHALWEAAIAQGARVAARGGDVIVRGGVERVSGDAGRHKAAGVRQRGCRKRPSGAHALSALRGRGVR